ncbi:hypothetical protein [Tenacibaculum agarivorans]|uniref:hypothetical protein n=1 Tax=Tenacibaculum agarivorans TaxID=1908389 RepID=UPI00094B9011|nr:hypothetical protein [Tenacibaculum agarivorans]
MKKFKYHNQYLEKIELLRAIYEDAKSIDPEYREDFIEEAKKQYNIENKKFDDMQSEERKNKEWSIKAVVFFGVIFILILLVIAIFIPNPTQFQIFIFRIIMGLSAAAVGGIIPGFIDIDLPINKGYLKAGGALALFIVIY